MTATIPESAFVPTCKRFIKGADGLTRVEPVCTCAAPPSYVGTAQRTNPGCLVHGPHTVVSLTESIYDSPDDLIDFTGPDKGRKTRGEEYARRKRSKLVQ